MTKKKYAYDTKKLVYELKSLGRYTTEASINDAVKKSKVGHFNNDGTIDTKVNAYV